MLTNVYTKSVRDRSTSMLIAAISTALMFVFGMAVYRDIDLSVYTDLPEVFRSMFGIGGEDTDVGGLAYEALMASYGMLVMAGVAIAAGATSIAGEEKKGTIGILLSNPLSRSTYVASKAGGVFTALVAGFVVLWVAALVVPQVLDVSTAGYDVNALMLMMFVNAVFYGFLALSIGAWSGNTGVASGVSAGLMIVGFLAVGLLPLVESLAGLAKVFPWYYYNSGDALNQGMPWGDFAILVGLAAVFAIAAFVGFNRRDLRSRSVGVKMIDRLRDNKYTHVVADRLAGTARVSHIWVKTASEHQVLLYIAASGMFVMTVIIGPMYNLIEDSLKTLGDSIPEELMALFGGGNMSTPEGWYQVEMFGLMLPIATITVAVVVGTAAIAGEENRNTMGLLLANPVRRSTVILQKTGTMVLFAAIVGAAAFLGTMAGSLLGDLGLDVQNVAAASALGTLLGLVFGAIALALGAATGRTQIAAYGATGLAVASFVANGFLPLSDSLEGLARFQPFYYYLTSDPLNNGMDWAHAGVLAGLIVVFVSAALALFQRRDLR
jgi:ABC-2 type transport system permease protein